MFNNTTNTTFLSQTQHRGCVVKCVLFFCIKFYVCLFGLLLSTGMLFAQNKIPVYIAEGTETVGFEKVYSSNSETTSTSSTQIYVLNGTPIYNGEGLKITQVASEQTNIYVVENTSLYNFDNHQITYIKNTESVAKPKLDKREEEADKLVTKAKVKPELVQGKIKPLPINFPIPTEDNSSHSVFASTSNISFQKQSKKETLFLFTTLEGITNFHTTKTKPNSIYFADGIRSYLLPTVLYNRPPPC